MDMQIPLTRSLVLIGGGHAHALVLRQWGMKPLPGVQVTLINPDPSAPYTGMLPGHLAGHYDREALDIDLVRLARFAGARLVLDRATGLDRGARRVRLAGRPDIHYDALSVDVGITSEMPSLPGFSAYGVAAKPLGLLAGRWRDFLGAVRAGEKAPDVVIIGAGVGGVEIALAMAHRLTTDGIENARVTLLDSGQGLAGLGPGARRAVTGRLKGLGIALYTDVQVTSLHEDGVVLSSGEVLASSFTVGSAGARPHDWLSQTGLDLTGGFITVDNTLCSVSDRTIFGAGDCVHLSHAPRPKAGVYAVRAAPVLFANLQARLSGDSLRSYWPQRDYLKLISLGEQSAVADKFGLRLEGEWVWRLKDRIDRRFMEKFSTLPKMSRPKLPARIAEGVRETWNGDQMPCAGCGSKVGPGALKGVLRSLPEPHRGDVVSKTGDDAAILDLHGSRQVISTDHLRAFTEDPWMFARIAAIHAMGDIWAMGAQPQAVLASVVLPRMNERLQKEMLQEIMTGAAGVVREAGADLVGGHTTLGAELTLGFTVTGLANQAPVLLSGARPRDVLILTKPLGSGTILAGEMALKARGAWVETALAFMAQSQGEAAAILTGSSGTGTLSNGGLPVAHAMTDVTGFGLAGHLMGILEASGMAARLDLDAVCFMEGAVALASQEVRSTLYPANRTAIDAVSCPDDPRAHLLFDPQTAGGLLAAVAQEHCDGMLDRLREAGYTAACIGVIKPGPPFLTVD